MHLLPLTLVAATLAVAAPLASNNDDDNNNNQTTPLSLRSSFTGSINFFQRYDCQDNCVENGLCLSGQTDHGMKGSEQDFIGWDSGCWDVPKGAHSVSISISNGHKFSGVDKSCKDFKASQFQGQRSPMHVGKKGHAKCNLLQPGTPVKAVFYHWES